MFGVGREKGHRAHGLSQCGGSGQVTQGKVSSLQQTCPRCRGAGRVISDPCVKCHVKAVFKNVQDASVKVPAGVDTGDRIRLSGQGEAGPNGGPPALMFRFR